MPMPPPRIPGEILCDAVYSLNEFKARTGLGSAAVRTARRNGLRVIRPGSRYGFVIGSDFIDYLKRIDDAQQQTGGR